MSLEKFFKKHTYIKVHMIVQGVELSFLDKEHEYTSNEGLFKHLGIKNMPKDYYLRVEKADKKGDATFGKLSVEYYGITSNEFINNTLIPYNDVSAIDFVKQRGAAVKYGGDSLVIFFEKIKGNYWIVRGDTMEAVHERFLEKVLGVTID